MTIAWTADLDTGIEPIDVQHRQLVDYINDLDVAAETGNRKAVAEVLELLIEYTLSHFAFEEQLLIDAGYTFAAAHKSMHDVFVKRVERYKDRFQAGEDIVAELQRMLKSWLVHHIKRDDKQYAVSLQSKMKALVEDKKETGWLARSLGKFFK
jgi:hemerythrin